MANIITPLVDTPFFELCNQLPVLTSAVSSMVTTEDGSGRFIYYLNVSNFYRYDTWNDTWMQLPNPSVAPTGLIAMSYTNRRGSHGRVLSATSTSVTIGAISTSIFNGSTMTIEHGDGRGEKRVITQTAETVHDAGVVTAVSTSVLTDGLKKWRVNQWSGYTVGIRYGTDATHYRRVLYNDATTLYFYDANLLPHEPWNNYPYVAASPYAVPVATAGAQAMYEIMSQTFSVDTPWDAIPDRTSYFSTNTGGIYVLTSQAGAPFFNLQYFDIAMMTWQPKTCPQGLLGGAIAGDITIERTGKYGNVSLTGTASSAGSRTIVDASKALEFDRYRNYRLYITDGAGQGQSRRIVAHNATTFTIARNWTITPDSTSAYEVWPDYDRLYMLGNNSSAMYAYSPENDYWMQGQGFDDGMMTNVAADYSDWVPFAVSTGVPIAAGVLTVDSAPTAGGTNYTIGDLLTCSVGGTGAQVQVTSIAPGGIVTGIQLVHTGTATGFTTGTGKATTGGTGTGCTINITAVGRTALVTTASSHILQTGDEITIAGANEAAWNATYTIIGAPSFTTFCVATTATANIAATASQSTTTIVDPSKNWIVNEHVGRIVHIMTSGPTPTSQTRWIASNTATTITFTLAITAAVPGQSKYAIYDAKAFGVDVQRKETGMDSEGWATGGSTTTLVDSTKFWVPNQWAGYFFKVEAGTGYGSGRIAIISNTANTLTFATQTFSPDATTKYDIADTWGLATAGATTSTTETGSKNWAVNQWAGKRVRFLAGAGFGAGAEATITSNTNNTLTYGATTATDASSVYSIYGIPPRGAGIDLIWAFGASGASNRQRYMYSPRGGLSNQIDIYDITTGRWRVGNFFAPMNELYTTGSNYAYDGVDGIFLTKNVAALVTRIFKLDLSTGDAYGMGTTTTLSGTVHIGNLMEIVENNGNKFLYLAHSTSTVMVRALIP